MFRRLGLWPALVLLLPLLLAAPPSARAGSADAEACERAIVEGARRGGVPEKVLHAISLTETGRPDSGRLRPWPWAVNREGKGYWFSSREEALAFARASIAQGRHSFDVGCFQINFHWHGRNFPSVETMFDPDASAAYAARFLRELYEQRGSWPAAAGAYHSQTPERAGTYRARFERILAGLGTNPITLAAGAPEPAGPDIPPHKSRTRLSRGPKIISVPARAAAPTAASEEAALAVPAWPGAI